MQADGDQLLFSPTDLTAFLECEHLIALEVERCRAGKLSIEFQDAEAELRRRLGGEHEAGCRRRFLEEGRRLVDIARPGKDPNAWSIRAAETIDAMCSGADVVYQGVLLQGRWRGIADFIVRV